MKLPTFKRLYNTEFSPDEQQFAEKIAFPLNNGIEVLYDLANQNISFTDNLAGSLKTFNITVNGAGTPTTPTTIPLNSTNRVIGLLVINQLNQTNPNVYPSSGIIISFQQNKNSLIVNNVAGLPAGYNFQLTVFAIN